MQVKINRDLSVKGNLLALIKANNPRFNNVTEDMFSLVRCGTLASIGQANKLYTYQHNSNPVSIELKDYFVIRGVPHYGLSLDEYMFFYNRIDLSSLQIAEVAGTDTYNWDNLSQYTGGSTTELQQKWTSGITALRAESLFDKYKAIIGGTVGISHYDSTWDITRPTIKEESSNDNRHSGTIPNIHLGIHNANYGETTPILAKYKHNLIYNNATNYPDWRDNCSSDNSSNSVKVASVSYEPNTKVKGEFLYKGKVQVNLK